MQDIDLNNITTDRLLLPVFAENNLEADVLRLDKIHPDVSGNKWFKLRYYLEEAGNTDKKTIVTFGGAWSNHILATAAFCRLKNFHSIGVIRGEEAGANSPVLARAKEFGMRLVFQSRDNYRDKKLPVELNDPGYYLIPEGGYGIKGADGAATIYAHFEKNKYTHICCAAGTGTMTAGLIINANSSQDIIGVSVLKNNTALEDEIRKLAGNKMKNYRLAHDYHFGGYAKHSPALIEFMNEMFRLSGIPSDFVYTGKLFFAVNDLAAKKYFSRGSRILIIHSGGLPGNISLGKGTLIF